MKIYLIVGTQGDYSDQSTWPVRAYTDKARAEAAVQDLAARSNKIFESRPQWAPGVRPAPEEYRSVMAAWKVLAASIWGDADPGHVWDYGWDLPYYEIREVELVDE